MNNRRLLLSVLFAAGPAALLTGLAAGASPTASTPPVEAAKRTRYPALSPDGRTIAFTYQGDLWSVPSQGGRAVRLTSHIAREVQPTYSPDGKSILFSSNRHGGYDLFLMPAEGGPARRLTFHSSSEFPSGFTPDGQWVLFYGGAYGSTDIYKVRTNGGEPIRLTWDRHEREYFGDVSPDGRRILFNHNSSPGSWRRRGYVGSYNADVWVADFTTPFSNLQRITTNPSDDFRPFFSRDGSRIYYVSDRKGQVNLWSMDLKGGAQRQLTFHTTDGARIPSYAPLGEKIAYEYNSEIWLLDLKSGKSAAVPIEVRTDERRNLTSETTITANPTEYTVSPDGRKVALIVRGDLFVVPASGGTARRLAGGASRESHVAWMPDSKTLLFTSDVNGQKDLFRIGIDGSDRKALAVTPEDEFYGQPSPDGKWIAFHRGEKSLVVIPADGGDPAATISGSFYEVARGSSPRFSWAPDNKSLAFKMTGSQLEDAVYVASVEDPQPRRATRFFRDAGTPRWSPRADMLYFTAIAVDSRNLYAVDLGEEPKPEFEEDALDRLDQPRQATQVAAGPPVVNIAWDHVQERLRRVTSTGGVSDAVLHPNGSAFLLDTGGGIRMISATEENGSGAAFADNANGVELPRDGSRVFFFSGGQVQSVGLAARDRRTTSFKATVEIDLAADNRQVFSEAWWLMDRTFYNERLNGVDWKAVRAKYEALLPHAPYKDDLYDLMAEMVQELRGSHLGVSGPSDYSAPTSTSTAYLGIEPDWATLDREGKYRIARVTPGSPAESKWSRLSPGEYVLAVNGQALGQKVTFDELLDRMAGKKVVLTVNAQPTPDGAREVALKPLAPNAGSDLEYHAWVRERRRLVRDLSGGRIAYLHIEGMNRPSELKFKEELISEGTGKDGMLVDVRYNGGGNVAHRLLDILRKKPYVKFVPRSLGQEVISDWYPDYLWGKPAALLINQDSASNSEMMAEGFRSLGIGPCVGVPTMGAVIATTGWTFLDGGTIRLPNAGVFTASGEDMDLRGRQPDIPVPYDPMAIQAGRDPQLEKAVEVILQKLPRVAGKAN